MSEPDEPLTIEGLPTPAVPHVVTDGITAGPTLPDPSETDGITDGAAVPDARETEGPPPVGMERHSIARNARTLLVAQGLTWTMALVLTAVQPRLIGPEGLGDLRLAGSLWGIAAIFFAFGLGGPVMMAFARDKGSARDVGTAMTIQTIAWTISFAVMVGYCLLVGYEGRLFAIILISGVAPLLLSWGDLGRATFFGLERMGWPSKVDIALKAFTLGITVAVLVIGGRSVAMAVVGAVAAAFYVGLMLFGLKRSAGLSIRPHLTGARRLMKLALPFLMIDASVVIYRQSDTLIIEALSDSTQVGWYSVAETFLGSLVVIPTLALTAVFPALTRTSSESPERALRQVRRGMRMLWLFAVPLGLGTAVVAQPLADLLFGPAYAKSGPILAVMGIVMIVMIPTILIGNYALAVGRQKRWVAISWTALIVSIPLHLIIDPWTNRQFGSAALGASIVFGITEALILVLAVWRVAPNLFDRALTTAFIKVFAAGLIMAAATWPLRHRFLLIPVSVGVLVFVVAVLALRTLDADEKGLLLQARQRYLKR